MIRIGSIYSVRAHRASVHHPSCPARTGAGACLGCGGSRAVEVPSTTCLDVMSERERDYHSSTAVGR